MNTDTENKDLIRRWIAFANQGFPGSFESFVAADYVGHLGAATMDGEELEHLERQFRMAFPDVQHTIDDLIAEGGRRSNDGASDPSRRLRGHCPDGSLSRIYRDRRVPNT